MSNLTSDGSHFQKFHLRCQGMCSSRKQFFACFEIDEGHILGEGLAKNNQRLALKDEDMAAVIKNGRLNFSRCREAKGTCEIAIEGMFKDFSWINFSASGPTVEMIEPWAQVRIVVREGKPRHLVVTAYVLIPAENRSFVEVTRGIWK